VRTRFSNRKPQSHAYAPLSPVLHYACHRDGGPGEDPLFTDFTATSEPPPIRGLFNYGENRPDALGYVANPAGPLFVDGGVGSCLHLLSQPSAVNQRWLKLAPDNQARIRVPNCATWTSGPIRPS
jgi:cytochrome c peroxidase